MKIRAKYINLTPNRIVDFDLTPIADKEICGILDFCDCPLIDEDGTNLVEISEYTLIDG